MFEPLVNAIRRLRCEDLKHEPREINAPVSGPETKIEYRQQISEQCTQTQILHRCF